MIKVFFILGFVFANFFSAYAAETISSDQPGQSTGASVLDKRYLQYQTNFDHSKNQNFKTNALNTTLRLGVFERLELNGEANFSRLDVDGSETEDSWTFGFRYKIFDDSKGLPLVFQARYGESSSFYRLNTLLAASGNIKGDFNWGANLIYNLIEETGNRIAYTFNVSYSLSQKTTVFIENYGHNQNDQNWTFFDTGFSYFINKDLQFDSALGYGNTRGEESFFFNIGLSGRFKIL